MHLRLFLRSLSRVAREGAVANVFIAADPCIRDAARTEESRRSLPLLWEDRRRGNPPHGRWNRDRRHGANPRTVDEPGANRGYVADRTRRRLACGTGPGSRDEGPRTRAGEGLRLQAHADGRAAPGTAGESAAPEKSTAAEESARQESAAEEEGACQTKSHPRTA